VARIFGLQQQFGHLPFAFTTESEPFARTMPRPFTVGMLPLLAITLLQLQRFVDPAKNEFVVLVAMGVAE
jgi:hypothetical protein